MCNWAQRERQLPYPVGLQEGGRHLAVGVVAAAVTVAGDKQAHCALGGGGVASRPCFSSLPLFLRQCGVCNTKRKAVVLSTALESVVLRKLQGGRSVEHETQEPGRQEQGVVWVLAGHKVNLTSGQPLPPWGGLCLLL